jgi:FAD:protein FMN transferase
MPPGTMASLASSAVFTSLLALLGLGQGLFAAAQDSPQDLRRFSFTAPAMGTRFHITLYAPEAHYPEAEAAALAAFDRVASLNATFSDYEPNSEINRASAATSPWSASPDLFALSSRALQLAQLTDGAFDPTLGQLSRLWRSARQRQKLAPPDRLQKALAATGWQHLRLHPATQSLSLTQPNLLLDFGGIAKGYAADQMLELLKSSGFPIALVLAGGDTAAGDPPPGQTGWAVTLRTGIDDSSPVSLPLANRSVSTSGDLYQFIELDGTRYSHLIDPKTGLGLTRRIACSVIAPDTTTSDALATALCLLGPEAGLKIAAAERLTVRWTWLDEAGHTHHLWHFSK